MACISGAFRWEDGVKIPAVVLFPNAPPQTTGGKMGCRALIDTGASGTCISARIVQKLRLPFDSMRRVKSVTHSAFVEVYSFQIGIVTGEILERDIDRTISKFKADYALFNPILRGAIFRWENFDFDVLLGRDILRLCSFKTDPDGHFSLCW
jgi:predicted aspartyl protease